MSLEETLPGVRERVSGCVSRQGKSAYLHACNASGTLGMRAHQCVIAHPCPCSPCRGAHSWLFVHAVPVHACLCMWCLSMPTYACDAWQTMSMNHACSAPCIRNMHLRHACTPPRHTVHACMHGVYLAHSACMPTLPHAVHARLLHAHGPICSAA